MVSNAARKYEEEQVPVTPIDQPQPGVQPVRWSRFERLLMVVGSAVTLLLIIALLSTKISINTCRTYNRRLPRLKITTLVTGRKLLI